jgi:branched-chain amino acid transport system ATP-binding protein
LRCGYGHAEVIHGISLDIYSGETVCLLGSNGAGKTTTIRALNGQVRPVQGTIEFDGAEISGKPATAIVASGIATVPEGRCIFPSLTVAENLRMGAYWRRGQYRGGSEIGEMWELFPHLSSRQSQPGGTLSGGEQQMLAIARALMSRPKLLLLDEPSMGLAPKLVDMVFDTIDRLATAGTTILLVEQNAEAALQVADRGYVMERGRILLNGNAEALYFNSEVQSAYLGIG